MKKWLYSACVLLGAPGLVTAQMVPSPLNTQASSPPLARADDPSATVPPVVYQSVFAGTPTGVDMQTLDWKRANADVGQFKRGHADLLKWEEAQTPAPAPAPSSVPGTHKHPGMP